MRTQTKQMTLSWLRSRHDFGHGPQDAIGYGRRASKTALAVTIL